MAERSPEEAAFEDALAGLHEGADPAVFERFLAAWGGDPLRLLAALRREVPGSFLELVGGRRPWSDDRRVAGVLVQNPRTPAHVAMRLVSTLFWRDLAAAAVNPWIAATVRVRAEALLAEGLRDMRLGEKVALARLASPTVLRLLLHEGDARILEGALFNPRLAESQVLQALRRETAGRPLFEAVAASPRWQAAYAVRLELVLQRRTPLPIGLAQVTALLPADLRRVARTPGLHPVLRAAAERALEPHPGRNPRR